jgi:hypothetical protein
MLKSLAVFFATILLAFSVEGSNRFRGFEKGQQGISLMAGQPMLVRYQYFLSWKQSLFCDFGYNVSERVGLAEAFYVFYFYDESDTWRKKEVTNSIVFYGGPGVLTGFGLNDADEKNDTQLAIKGIGGVEYVFGLGRWSLKGEIGAGMFALGRTFMEIHGSVGLSFYWGRDFGTSKKAKKEKKKKRRRRKKKR